jgi:hypothetical protein
VGSCHRQLKRSSAMRDCFLSRVGTVNTARIYGLLLLGGLVSIVGCQAKWRNDQFEGTWRVDTSDSPASGARSIAMTFTLGQDGRFVASSVSSDFLELDDLKPDRLLSGSGTWSLTRLDPEGEERLRLSFKKVEGSTGRNLPYGAELFIQGSSREPRLFYFIGDPDESQRVVFRQESPHR